VVAAGVTFPRLPARGWRWAIFALGVSACLPPAHADDPPAGALPAPVLKVLRAQGLPLNGLSVYVRELGAPAPLVAVAPDTPRNPASVMKVLTTLVALEELGPAYTWKTEAYATGPVRDGHLKGDLYLKGYGDPYLVIEQFWRLLRGLRDAGIQTIDGDLVLDHSYFEPETPGDPGEFDGQEMRAYNVLPSALLVNFQAVDFRFVPEPDENRVQIIADPRPENVEIENRLKLTRNGCRGFARHLGMQVRRSGKRERIIFGGSYDAVCGENDLFRVVSEPAPYIEGVFRSMWLEQGGRFDGGVHEARVPDGARLLYAIASPPLADIIRSINKYSNNVMTRQLLLTLGAERVRPPGTIGKGEMVARAWLMRHGMTFPELTIENGSGLSREARISARHLGELLEIAWNSPYMPEFLSSLPLAALDGTLRRRFQGTELEGRLHMKTGSLNGVRSMAGYLLDRQGRRVIVVMLHNHPRLGTANAEAVQDALLHWVYARP
jgi:D-alanyl-D-alanine carboxypeptidase/D-alanyl-D-alanine-endopeptidase (penicillin-binding protein 4)